VAAIGDPDGDLVAILEAHQRIARLLTMGKLVSILI